MWKIACRATHQINFEPRARRKMTNLRAKRTLVLALTTLFGSFVTSGCNRYEYRQEADDEAYCLIHEKDNDPRWDSPGFTIEVDPRSRYYDVYDEVRSQF